MKPIKISALLCLLLLLSTCAPGGEVEQPEQQNRMEPALQPEQRSEQLEENLMRREFCTVQEIDEEYFVLKNTKGELYHVDCSFLGEFKTEDEVLLIYSERSPIEEGIFQAEIRSIFPDSSQLAYPAN